MDLLTDAAVLDDATAREFDFEQPLARVVAGAAQFTRLRSMRCPFRQPPGSR